MRNGGKGFVFDLTIEPLFDGDGNVVGITGACMDIAKIRELADRLQDSRDRLQQEKSYLETEIQPSWDSNTLLEKAPHCERFLRKLGSSLRPTRLCYCSVKRERGRTGGSFTAFAEYAA